MSRNEYLITIDGVYYTTILEASRKLNTHEDEARQLITSLKYGSETKAVYKGHKVEYHRVNKRPRKQLEHVKGTPLLVRRPIGYYSLG